MDMIDPDLPFWEIFFFLIMPKSYKINRFFFFFF